MSLTTCCDEFFPKKWQNISKLVHKCVPAILVTAIGNAIVQRPNPSFVLLSADRTGEAGSRRSGRKIAWRTWQVGPIQHLLWTRKSRVTTNASGIAAAASRYWAYTCPKVSILKFQTQLSPAQSNGFSKVTLSNDNGPPEEEWPLYYESNRTATFQTLRF